MGLFSSKSSSTSTTYNQSAQSSGSIGDLSSDNTIAGGDINYNPVGLVGEELQTILNQNQSLFDATVAAVQKSAETAINTAASAYQDATGTTKNFFESVKPIALYGALAVVAVYALKGK